MIFVEFSAFQKQRQDYLDDESFRDLQNTTLHNPELGSLVPGTGGLRKLRWAAKGKGKRGGARIIYYYLTTKDIVFLFIVYVKNVQEDLTPEQKRVLKALLEDELRSL